MKILVTGGMGFIGSAVCRRLVKETDHVIFNIDKGTYAANAKSIQSLLGCENFINIIYDLSDQHNIFRVLNSMKPDAILHLAAETHVDNSIIDPETFVNSNIIGTFNLLEWVRKNPETRFHYVSTDEVFGSLELPDCFSETSPIRPRNPYSATKAAAEHLVRAYTNTYKLNTVITNCCNNYGPWQNEEKLIPKTIINAIKGKKIPVYGSGGGIRDWLYVEDHVSALLTVLFDRESDIGETYCIGAQQSYSSIYIVLRICELLSQKFIPSIAYEDLISFVPDRPGADLAYALDTTKINCKLGWRPEETLETGLAKTIDWYLAYYKGDSRLGKGPQCN